MFYSKYGYVIFHVISEIFNEIPVKSQSRSLKVVPFDRLGICFPISFLW